jgi:hypothetical protein
MTCTEPSWGGIRRSIRHTGVEKTKRTCPRGLYDQGMCREKEESAKEALVQRINKRSNFSSYRREEDTSEMRVLSLMLRKHLINLTETMKERESLRNCMSFPSDIMAWHRGGQSSKSEFL